MNDPRRCPVCGGPSKVLHVRPAGTCAKRRRACDAQTPCPVRWTTYERRSKVLAFEPDEEKVPPVVHPPRDLAPKS